MSYEVLARKLRPMGFEALVGQDHVVRALRHALDHDRLHHAYLFTGTRGVGKTTIARIVAKSLNCELGVSATPCEQCSICLEIKDNRFVDLIEVDAASRTGVDDTRELLENAQYLPTRGRYKVYLIDEVHMLSTASFNALLKTLEEPPQHVKFLLATTDPKKVPATVLSRCLQFQLRNLSRDVITGYLREVLTAESVSFDEAALEVIGRSAAGSMRDALSLTDQAIAFGQGALRAQEVTDMLGVVGRDEVAALMQGLEQGSAQMLMDSAAELAQRGADFSDVLRGLMEALHDLSVQSALGQKSPPGENGAGFSAEELQLYYQIALIGVRDLTIAPDERSGFEMTLLRMLTFAPESGSAVPPRNNDVAEGQPRSRDSANTPSTTAEPAQSATRPPKPESNPSVAQAEPPRTVAAPTAPTVPSPPAVVESSGKQLAVNDVEGAQQPAEAKRNEYTDPQRQDIESAGLASQWFEIVSQLSIGGVTKMIAEHCVLDHFALPEVTLRLDQGHDTLLNHSQIERLSRALTEVLGEPVKLQITPGAIDQETPAQRREREAKERQKLAEQSIAEDENVQHLLAEFGGTVEEIRPL